MTMSTNMSNGDNLSEKESFPAGFGTWRSALGSPLVLGLAVLLTVQLIAAIGLGGRNALAPADPDGPLLRFDPKAVTDIRIDGASGGQVHLSRQGESWAIADLDDFPANAVQVQALIERLSGLKRPLPLATSDEAQRRHGVADEAPERRVTLESNGKTLASLLLGESPGFRRVFGRPAGDGAVYDLNLALADVSNRRDDWLAQDQLQVPRESIARVTGKDWELVKGEGGWQLAGAGEAQVQSAVDELLSRLGKLGYRGVLGREDRPEFNQADPALVLGLDLGKGPVEYRISRLKDSADYVLKTGDRPWYFRLSEFDLEGLLDLSRDRFLAPASAATQAPGTEDTGTGDSGAQARPSAPGSGGESQATPPPADPLPAPGPVGES